MNEQTAAKTGTLATGFAMFSMFFGAGNVVYPLDLGKMAMDMNIYGIIGFLLAGVGVPFLGLAAMALFNGNYMHFFERIGKVPAFIVILCIMGLIGPFGATPRTIAFAYSTMTHFWESQGWAWISLPVFSFISCLLIFAFTFRKSKILDVLGYFLTPLLLLSLSILIIKGLWGAPTPPVSNLAAGEVFLAGVSEGYKTMDLLATFFFSSVVISCLEADRTPGDHKSYRSVIFKTLKASMIGAGLLGLSYTAFSIVSSSYALDLQGVADDQVLSALALDIMGPWGAVIAIIAVSLACLTTAIALVVVFSEYLHQDIFKDKVSYFPCLMTTIAITYVFSTFGFKGIMTMLIPVLQICYPALIVLSILNIAHKLRHFQPVKVPVALTFLGSIGAYFFYTV